MEWEDGQLMTAYAIRDDGGPFPEDGESMISYYNRVLAWAKGKGYDVRLNEAGYPIFYGFAPKTNTMGWVAAGLAVAISIVILANRKKMV